MRLRDAGLTWQKIGDDIVVLDLDGSVYLQVNGSGRVLWEALADSATEPELVDILIEQFGIDRTRAESDVAAFLADLRVRSLVED